MTKQETLNKFRFERDKWFLSILKDLKIIEINSNCIEYHNSKNELIIRYNKNGVFYLDNDTIILVMQNKYKMEYDDIHKYVKDIMNLNWSGKIIYWQHFLD
jgi:hypothetical protein